MAEAIASSNSLVNVCPFCDKKLENEFELRSHLEEIHNISLTYTNEKQCEADFEGTPKYYKISEHESKKELLLGGKIKELKMVLKENIGLYMQQIKLWIRCDITRLQLHQNVSSLFTPETIKIHNEFLLYFLKDIRTISRLCKATKVDSFDYITEELPPLEMPSNQVIKNISKAIAIRRKCIKVKPNGLVYDTGKVDSKDISPDDQPKYSGSVTLPELLDALEANPELIPLKSIYNITIQTIMKSLERQKVKSQGDSEKEDN